MASPILHIKDSYYFEVPKAIWRHKHESRESFPEVWVRLDPDFQLWEAEQLHHLLTELPAEVGVPSQHELSEDYEHWKHEDHANAGKPFVSYLKESPSAKWFQDNVNLDDPQWLQENQEWAEKWQEATANTKEANKKKVDEYNELEEHAWSEEKIEGYNKALDGKILIPQPFGNLKNLYESQNGFCISKFMVIELVVALIISAVFIWLGRKVQSGQRPVGKLWNMLEAVLLYMRDHVARPAIGKHEADKYVPLLWTFFFFVLGCNLFGMLPWAGAPTGAFGVTLALAGVTFATGLVCGTLKFGPLGFWKNQVPGMDLPLVMAIVLIPMIFLIEVLGMFIKHGVLGVRLLANMVAGHVVLLGILTLAFSLEGAASDVWWLTAVISIVSSTLFSCLELFVAFLQAYVFTFLSALFIGAAIHHH